MNKNGLGNLEKQFLINVHPHLVDLTNYDEIKKAFLIIHKFLNLVEKLQLISALIRFKNRCSLLFRPVVKLLSHLVVPCCLNVKLLVQNLATTLKLISLGVRLLGMA